MSRALQLDFSVLQKETNKSRRVELLSQVFPKLFCTHSEKNHPLLSKQM